MTDKMRELLDRYELYARARGFSPASIGHVRRCVGFFDDFLHGNTDAGKVTADDFRRFLSDLRERPVWGGLKGEKGRRLSGTSQNTYARAVKAFFDWLKAEDIITNNPLAAVPAPRKPKTMPKIYSENELNAVFKAAATNIRDQAIFYLFLDSGVRLAELSRLKVSDIDLLEGEFKVLGKGGKERFAYFSPLTAASLDSYVKKHRYAAAPNERLFVAADGHPLSTSGIQSLLERLGRRAGIKERLSPHKLRHTWATLSLKYGGNLEYIRKILGHSDIQTTSEAYLNVQDADVKAAYMNFSPLANLKAAGDGKRFVLPDERRPRDQQEVPGTQPQQKLYEETPHKQEIRASAKKLAEGIRLPSLTDNRMWDDLPTEFLPGKYFLPIGEIDIGKNRQVSVKYHMDTGITTPRLLERLYSHLSTSGFPKFSELVGEQGKLERWAGEVGQYCKAGINLLKLIIDDVEAHRTNVFFGDETKPGLTKWFPLTVWSDVIQKAGGYSWIRQSWYHPPENISGSNLWRLRCGAYPIGIAKTKTRLKTYENWHKTLRENYAISQAVKDINKRHLKLDETATQIKQLFLDFSDMEHLPGSCDL
jgi:integrase/recombinase XerC